MAGIERRQQTPWHLWLLGGLSLLWNGFGTFDLVMTITRGAEYLRKSGLSEASIIWFQTMPQWMYVPWALGVVGGVIAALYLLLRSRGAVAAYALSLAGAVGSNLVQKFGLAGSMPQAEGFMAYFPYVIIALAVLQWFYAWRMAKRSVLV